MLERSGLDGVRPTAISANPLDARGGEIAVHAWLDDGQVASFIRPVEHMPNGNANTWIAIKELRRVVA